MCNLNHNLYFILESTTTDNIDTTLINYEYTLTCDRRDNKKYLDIIDDMFLRDITIKFIQFAVRKDIRLVERLVYPGF